MPVFQKAFVLIKVAPGHTEDVVDALMKIPEVTEAHIVPGDWDVIAVISAQKEIVVPSDEKVYRLVLDKVVKIRHVQDTSTMVSQFSKTK
ncbi:MAG: Lrp/AsnC ligand binding domain-containing protein [Nitrososphaerota archaeon]|nr:Lrp/AsnC ligand binding domain-containing protein [Nitrososphaerota archaeon]MDG6983308.1 Lrp/AsnC ligand binding domain-containing protein [Nitrososphaerota archaeon]